MYPEKHHNRGRDLAFLTPAKNVERRLEPMKVNVALFDDEQDVEKEELQGEEPAGKSPPYVPDEDGDDEEDESDSHSRLKTALLVALMLGGFAVFVFNMMGFVNNVRLDNQGTPNAIYEELDRLEHFLDVGDDGSVTVSVAEREESEVPTHADRDGPPGGAAQTASPGSGDEDKDSQKAVDDALNYAALKEQELKNAEDMLDSALRRNDELQQQIDQLTGGS